jgi:hypothetical protein
LGSVPQDSYVVPYVDTLSDAIAIGDPNEQSNPETLVPLDESPTTGSQFSNTAVLRSLGLRILLGNELYRTQSESGDTSLRRVMIR